MGSNTAPSQAAKFEGGQVALIGFLYQMVGAAALQALATVPSEASSGKEYEPLAAVIQRGNLYNELSGVDAVAIADPDELGEFTKEGACNLIQFKFSQVHDVLDMGDLKVIIGRMGDAVKHWRKDLPTPNGFWIITSRHASAPVNKLLSAPADERTLSGLKALDLQVLRGLHLKCEEPFGTWHEKLFQLARLFGVFEYELRDRIPSLIAELVMESAGGVLAAVSRERVFRVITGYSDPHMLTSKEVAAKTRPRLEERAEFLEIEKMSGVPILRKHLLKQLDEKVASHALVVLFGGGGHGKSVLLWQLLNASINDGAAAPRACAEILPIVEVRGQTLLWSWVIAQWANAPDGNKLYTEQPVRALERLRLANSAIGKPLLFLGLDGLDDRSTTQPRVDALREMLQWFWRAERKIHLEAEQGIITLPEATLIVTCREPEELERWLEMPEWGRQYFIDDLCVPVGDFSGDELQDIATAYFPELASRFANRRDPGGSGSVTRFSRYTAVLGAMPLGMAPLGGMAMATSPAIAGDVMLALHHPAMWQAIRHLSSDQRPLVLDGDAEALRALASAFVTWFIRRTHRRGVLEDLSDSELRLLLQGIANKCPAEVTEAHPRESWIQSARDTGVVASEQFALKAWNEALSSGLIMKDAQITWRWRHPFVYEYLVSC